MPIAESVTLGKDVKIFHETLVNLYGCSVGDATKIGAFVEIQKGAFIGARCKIASHTFICEGVTIEDEVRPTCSFLRMLDMELAGSSPDPLVRVEDRRVSTRPIAGTRPRGETPERDRELENELLADRVASAAPPPPEPLGAGAGAAVADAVTNMTDERYMEMVAHMKEHILAGDIFQGVPSRRVTLPASRGGLPIYRHLRMSNPAPYMFFLRMLDMELAGSSPEPLVRVEDRRVSKETALITPGNPREGKQVFAVKGCIKCHAVRGEGGKEAEDLGKRAKTFYKSLTQIASSMWNKGPAVLGKMSQTQLGIPKFTPKEMADLIAFLYFLHFIDEPGNPVNGKRFF